MNSKRQTSQGQRRWLGGAIGATLAALVGLGLLRTGFGDGLTRRSYDIPFFTRAELLHRSLPSGEVRMLYLDEQSHKELGQPMNAWDRSLWAQLIDRLTAAGAKLIVFDLIFTDPLDPDSDKQVEEAIRKSGRVILAGCYHAAESSTNPAWEELPYGPFRAAAAAWGNPNLPPPDADDGERSFFPNVDNVAGTNVSWMPWLAAKLAGQQSLPTDLANLWFNFVGPPGTIDNVRVSQAFKGDFPQGFFKDKIVFIGQRLSADRFAATKDDFRTPYSDWGMGLSPGVDFHATATLNFLHHNWLSEMGWQVETIVALLIAVAFGFGLVKLPPLWATGAALAGMFLVTLTAHLLVWYGHIWFSWLIMLVEIAVALFSAIVANSLQLYVDKRLLQESLAARLSPAIAKRVIEDPALRRPGGVKQEVSIVFTDIANFSRVSEMMNADDLVNLLNRYFDAALKCVHDNDGTVMDLVGDAIFAIWNAPTEQAKHRELACRAAMSLHRQLIQFEETNRQLLLRTRVGLHTGTACVANIGSAVRFDYTAIGEAINLASRLEGLNKYLGTEVLATREIQRAVEGELTTRLVGHFKFKGFGRAVEIHELIGPPEEAERTRKWREEFADALQAWRQRKFDTAVEKFEAVSNMRRAAAVDGESQTAVLEADGPSRFYLHKIEEYRIRAPASDWMGEIDLTEK